MKKSNKLFMGLAVILLVGAGSCEIGLGPAVDVNAPTVEITYPPESRVIMDTFVLAGKCDDDSSIDTIFIDLENASENAAVKRFSYKVKPDEGGKTWQANINNIVGDKYELPDGKWTASVYVKDTVGRTSGTVSRSFDIDNTAPLLSLSNPNTVGDAPNPITFGAIIQIKGEITEEHETSNLRFYYQKVDASGNLIGEEKNIDRGAVSGLSADTPFVIARNYSTEEINSDEELQKLRDNYDYIHDLNFTKPATGDVDQKVYCAFELFDNARIYNDPQNINDDGFGDGNKSEKYKAGETTVNTLDENKKVTKDSSCFILNSDNSPRYSIDKVVDLTASSSSERFKKLSTGTKINLTIKAGKDNIIIEPKTVKVTLQQVNDDGTDLSPKPAPIVILDKGEWNDSDADKTVSKGVDILKEKGLEQGKYYKILVEAQDRNGIPAVPENGNIFGFHFDSSSLPPSIKIENIFKSTQTKRPGDADYNEDPSTLISHDVKINGNDLENAIYIPVTVDTNGVDLHKDNNTKLSDIIKIYPYKAKPMPNEGIRIRDSKSKDIDNDTTIKYFYPSNKAMSQKGTLPSYENFTYEEGVFKFEIKIDDTYAKNYPDKYTYSFILLVEGNTDSPKKAEKEISFTVDSAKPTVSNDSITPIVKKSGAETDDTINGKVKFEASVRDNFELFDTEYYVYGVDSSSKEHEVYKREFNSEAPNPSDISIDIDTFTDFTKKDYSKLIIKVNAKDSVGNINNFEKSYTINQEKDKPIISTLNFTDGSQNIFDSKRSLSLSVTDDDGIGEVTYSIDGATDVPVSAENGKPFDIPLTGLEAGEHKITVNATDSKKETNCYSNKIENVAFIIDNATPTIKETTIGSEASKFSNEYLNDEDKIILNLEVWDDWKVESVTCTENDNPATNVEISTDKKTATITPQSDGEYKYTFTVTDGSGKTASIIRNIIVDTTKPEYISSKIEPNGNDAWYNKTSLKINGTASDLYGVNKVEYSLDGGTTYKDILPIDTSKTTTDSSTRIQTVTFEGYLLGVENGNNVTLQITDNAGNKTETKAISNIKIDTVKPDTIELKSAAGDKFSNGQAKYDIEIKAEDNTNGSGVNKVELVLKDGSTEKNKEEATKDTTDTTKYTYTDYPATAGDLYARVTDNAGNVAEKFLFKISTDTTKPEATVKEVRYRKSGIALTKDTSGYYEDANKHIVISGTASDDKELSTVKLQYKLSTATDWIDYNVTNSGDINNWSYDVNTTELTDKKSYKFRIVATDRAGNEKESDPITVKINQDSDRPVIKITNLTINNMSDNPDGRVKLYNQRRVNFTVKDDDDVSKVEVKIHKVNENEDIDYKDCTNDEYIDIPSDGPINLSFRVTDGEGLAFETTETDITKRPKLYGNGDTEPVFGVTGKEDTTLYLIVDNDGPKIDNIKYASKKTADTEYSDDKISTNDLIIGGDYKKLKVTFTLQDANGIETVELKKGDTTLTENTDYKQTVTVDNEIATTKRTHNVLTYTIEDITVPREDSTTYSLTFTDYMGNSNMETFTVYADKDAPVLSVDSHIDNQVVGSSFVLKGKVDGIDENTKVKYFIDKNATATETDFASKEDLKNASAGYSSWRLYVDGDVNNPDGYTHVKSHKELIRDLFGANLYAGVLYTDNTHATKYTTVNTIYFHFYSVDAVGNSAIKSFPLQIDPQGDIPTIEVIYPTNGKTLTGKIRVQGTSSVYQDNNVAGIYMQIDPKVTTVPNFDNWKGSSAVNLKATDGTTKFSTTENPVEYIFSRVDSSRIPASEISKTDSEKIYGIYVGNKENWDYTINSNKELTSTNANDIAIRMYIVDDHGNVNIIKDSEYTKITIDDDVPSIGTFAAYQFAWKAEDGTVLYTNTSEPTTNTSEPTESSKAYSDSGCRNDEKSITEVTSTTIKVDGKTYTKDFKVTPYEKNMWLKGEWWLTGLVDDDSGIKTVKVFANGGETNVLAENITNATCIAKSETDKSGYLISYRIGVQDTNTTAGELSYRIFIEENKTNSPRSNEETFYINYDNKKPVSNKMNIGEDKTITNSLGFFELGTTAEEKGIQSGFARAVVYFTRDTTKSPTTIYDPYIRVKATGNEQSYSLLTNEDGLYWVNKTINSVSSKTVTINSTNENIHKGGLVKIAGAYYTITDVNGTSITLDKNPGDVSANTPMYFAIGIVVDQESEATGSTYISDDEGYGYYNISDNDDFMVESAITNSSNVTTWKANINSNNIPDGPLTIHYVVFDNAGNYSDENVEKNCVVKNNQLRFTGVKAWCDFNGNGQIDEAEDEVASYYNSSVDVKIDGAMTKRAGSGVLTNPSIDTGNSSFMTVKDKTYIYPEFIGGNGDILVKKTYAGSGSTTTYSKFSSGNEGNDYSGVDEEKDDSGYYKKDEQGAEIGYYEGRTAYPSTAVTEGTDPVFILTTSNLGSDSTSDTKLKTFKFEFKDSTDGTANEASITMKFLVKCNDNEAPKVAFGKFKYDATKTTKASRKVTSGETYSFVKDMDLKQGHVECEDDWMQAPGYNSEATSGEYDGDAKISGIVTLRGTVSDNIRIKEISIRPVNATTYTKVASLKTDGTIDYDTAGASLKYNESTGMGFEIESQKYTQEGHIVYWAYTFDSTTVNTNQVALDATFGVKVTDKNSKTTTETYQMDIVPYITKVSTPLDKYNSSNPTAFSRTAVGHYPLYATTKGFNNEAKVNAENAYFTVEGFNIKTANIISATAEGASSKTFDQDGTTKNMFTLTDSTISGAYEITVKGGVKTLNNKNLNTAEYNKQPNNLNNNVLTDDMIFDIWDINTRAVKAPNGDVDDPVMKINPSNGLIGFAFSNGAERFCMPGASTSYKKTSRSYDAMKHNALVYDKYGNSYGISVGGDIDEKSDNSNTADAMTLMTSRWNDAYVGDSLSTNRDATTDNRSILESIGLINNNKTSKSKDRFLSQSLSTYSIQANNKTYTYLYFAYYDDLLKQVKLKAGRTDGTKATFQNFQRISANAKTENDASNVQIIAANDTTNTLGKAGKYVSVAATTDEGKVALVWFDGTDLKYTYTTEPIVYKNGTDYEAQKGRVKDHTTVRWADATTVMAGFGQDCKVVVDGNNGVHIVAYDNKKMQLCYAYSSSYTTAPTEYYVIDAKNNVGKNLTLDVAKVGNYYIPYIGYWDNSLKLPRYTYLAKPNMFYDSSITDKEQKNGYNTSGTNKGYTGVWDCTIIPTLSRPRQGTVNVGVWRDTTNLAANNVGTLKNSNGKTNNSWSNLYTSSTNGTSGNCYGNGSSNAVLGYMINADSTVYIETAQIR